MPRRSALGRDRISRPRRSRPSALLRVFEFPSGGGGTHPLPTLPLKGRASSGGLRATGSKSAEAIGEGLDRLAGAGDGDRKSTRLNSSPTCASRVPSSDCKNQTIPYPEITST